MDTTTEKTMAASSGAEENKTEEEKEDDKRQRHAMKRQRAIEELVATEATYVTQLQLLLEHYANQLNDYKILKEKEYHTLFPNDLRIICNLNSRLLNDLMDRIDENFDNDKTVISDILINFAPYFKMYQSYMNNHEAAINCLTSAKENSKAFAKYEQAQRKYFNNLNLTSLLILPVQRIPRYKIIVAEIVKNTESDHCDLDGLNKALELIQSVNITNNQRLKDIDARSIVMKIESEMENLGNISLVTPSRVFVKQTNSDFENELYKVSDSSMKSVVFYLFNDCLIYAAPPSGGIFASKKTTFRMLLPFDSSFEIEDWADTDKMQSCFVIKSLFESFMIKCENEKVKQDWINILNDTLDEWRQTLVEHNQNSNNNNNNNSNQANFEIPFIYNDQCMKCDNRIEKSKRLFCTYCGDLTCPNCRDKKGTLPSKIDPSMTVRVCNDCQFSMMNMNMNTSRCNKVHSVYNVNSIKNVYNVYNVYKAQYKAQHRKSAPAQDKKKNKNTFSSSCHRNNKRIKIHNMTIIKNKNKNKNKTTKTKTKTTTPNKNANKKISNRASRANRMNPLTHGSLLKRKSHNPSALENNDLLMELRSKMNNKSLNKSSHVIRSLDLDRGSVSRATNHNIGNNNNKNNNNNNHSNRGGRPKVPNQPAPRKPTAKLSQSSQSSNSMQSPPSGSARSGSGNVSPGPSSPRGIKTPPLTKYKTTINVTPSSSSTHTSPRKKLPPVPSAAKNNKPKGRGPGGRPLPAAPNDRKKKRSMDEMDGGVGGVSPVATRNRGYGKLKSKQPPPPANPIPNDILKKYNKNKNGSKSGQNSPPKLPMSKTSTAKDFWQQHEKRSTFAQQKKENEKPKKGFKGFKGKKTATGGGSGATITLKQANSSQLSSFSPKHHKSHSSFGPNRNRGSHSSRSSQGGQTVFTGMGLPKVSNWSESESEDGSDNDEKSEIITKSHTFGVTVSTGTTKKKWPTVQTKKNTFGKSNKKNSINTKTNGIKSSTPHYQQSTTGFGLNNPNAKVKIISHTSYDSDNSFPRRSPSLRNDTMSNSSVASNGAKVPKSSKRRPPPRPPNRRGHGSMASNASNDGSSNLNVGVLGVPFGTTRGIAKSIHGMDGFAQFIWYVMS